MNWTEGIPEIAAVLAGTAVAVALAIWTAHRLDPGSPLLWILPELRPTRVEDEIERLVALADLARREGILAVEAHADACGDRVLLTGVRMMAEGAPDALLKEEVESALERLTAAEVRRGSGRWTRIMHVLVVAVAVCGLVTAWRCGILAKPGLAALTALSTCFLSLLALAFVGPVCDRALGGGATARAFAGLLSLEAVRLIARRADGAAVRARLTSLLPPSHRQSPARLAA